MLARFTGLAGAAAAAARPAAVLGLPLAHSAALGVLRSLPGPSSSGLGSFAPAVASSTPLPWVPSRGFAAPGGGSASKLSGNAKAKLEKEKRLKKRRAKLMLFKPKVGPFLHLDEAIRVVRASATANFDETIDIAVQLGVDPRKPGQNIRGVAQLPHGTGKPVTVAVFAKGEKAEEARRAGATYVGAEDLVDKIAKGEIPLTFNKTIATPDVMTLVGKVARLLGPRGLMPNPKLGTVTMAIKEAVSAAKKGQAEFRTEKRGIVMAGVGKASFPAAQLRDNLRSFLLAVNDAKPEGLKGTYMRSATLSSTMGVGVTLDMAVLDPASPRFMEPMPVSAGASAVAAAAAALAGPAPAGGAGTAAAVSASA